MAIPSYITQQVVDSSYQQRNIALLQSGPPDLYVVYDTLNATQKADLDLLVQANGGILPLASTFLWDTVIVSTGQTWRSAYIGLVRTLNHRFDATNIPADSVVVQLTTAQLAGAPSAAQLLHRNSTLFCDASAPFVLFRISNDGLSFSSVAGAGGASVYYAGAGLNLSNSIFSMPAVGTPVTSQFVKVSTDTYGRVSGTTAVLPSDVTTSLGYTPINKAGDTGIGSLTLSSTSTITIGARQMIPCYTAATFAAASTAAGTITGFCAFTVTASEKNNGQPTMYFSDGAGNMFWVASVKVV